MPFDYRAHRQPCAMNLMATFEPSRGWSLIVHVATPSESGVISDRLSYVGLTTDELADVIEATTQRKLGLI